jgi:hypothetical protein
MRTPYTNHKGHIIATVDDQRVLIDTGAPATVTTDYLGVSLDEIRKLVGIDFDVLMGMDVLQECTMELTSDTIDLDAAVPDEADSVGVEMNEEAFVPCITAKVNGRLRTMLLDTGAPVSYLREPLLGKVATQRTVEDFYPLLGTFETTTYKHAVTVGDKFMELYLGALPVTACPILDALGVDGILGTDMLQHYDMMFDFNWNRFHLIDKEQTDDK